MLDFTGQKTPRTCGGSDTEQDAACLSCARRRLRPKQQRADRQAERSGSVSGQGAGWREASASSSKRGWSPRDKMPHCCGRRSRRCCVALWSCNRSPDHCVTDDVAPCQNLVIRHGLKDPLQASCRKDLSRSSL